MFVQEMESSNIKVVRECKAVLGRLHAQVGPSLKALCRVEADAKVWPGVEKCFDASPYDPSLAQQQWPRRSIATASTIEGNGTVSLEVPKTDLKSVVSADMISQLVRLSCDQWYIFVSLTPDRMQRTGKRLGKFANKHWKISQPLSTHVAVSLISQNRSSQQSYHGHYEIDYQIPRST